MKHYNRSVKAEKVEYVDILGTRKENRIVGTRRKALYSVVEFTKQGEVKTYFTLKLGGKLKGCFNDLEQATIEYNSK